MSGQEVMDRGVTYPHRPELVKAGGRTVAGQSVGVTAPPWPELVKAGGKSVAGRIVGVNSPPMPELFEVGGRIVAGLHIGRNWSRLEEGAWTDELLRREVISPG